MKAMRGALSFLYGLWAYALFLGSFLYLIGFVEGVGVPTSVDAGRPAPLAEALLVDALLLGLFAAQHSLMARRSFKAWWTRLVPPAVERSTYVLFSSLALGLLLWQWRPVAEPLVWRVEGPGRWVPAAASWAGWGLALASTFLINHFELFGLRQVLARLRGRELPAPRFGTPGLYRWVRHPLYLGLLLAFWATPVMSAGHLLFALANTGFVLVGIAFEERDLTAQFGGRYRLYREQVGMLLPRPPRGSPGREPAGEG